jgi:hypothetical protein
MDTRTTDEVTDLAGCEVPPSRRKNAEQSNMLLGGASLAKFDMRSYARLGAAHRLTQIKQELSEILRQFPDLEAPRRSPGSPLPPNELATRGDDGNVTGVPRRRRRWKMSAAQKNAVSLRMKKYWAARKAKR